MFFIRKNSNSPILGSVEVETEAIPRSLQLQVQVETPKAKRVTHSSSRKMLSSKSKDTVIVDLEAMEIKFESPMAENVPKI